MTKPPRPIDSFEHDVANVRGLLLASFLSPEGLALLLGGVPISEARSYQDRALGSLARLKRAVEQAKRA